MKKLRSKKAMTLIEILAVITLVVIVGGYAFQKVRDILGGGKVKSASILLTNMSQALEIFYIDCSTFPSDAEGLDALKKKPSSLDCDTYNAKGYVKKIPKDPWNQELVYKSDGSDFELISKGPDKKIGTEDDISTKEED